MGVMMVIGLFTYRIILRALGITDYGVYSAVGGVVTLFMLVMNTVAGAVSRYITVGLGKGDPERLKTIFGTSLAVMAGFCLLIALLTETAGLWYLHHKMVIPPERLGAAAVVLHTSLLVLVVNLMSIPFTADINAHEHMGAYAWISILEAVLKLAVAAAVTGKYKSIGAVVCTVFGEARHEQRHEKNQGKGNTFFHVRFLPFLSCFLCFASLSDKSTI